MRLWRISNYADLSGRGGLFAAARWNHLNTPIVYCADHPASALLEILVNANPENWPATFQLIEVEVPEHVEIAEPNLPPNWREDERLTREIGTQFIAGRNRPVQRVPSAIMPFCFNYLINPHMADAAAIRIVAATRHPIDPRLVES
jgi:RES domain-containing protein